MSDPTAETEAQHQDQAAASDADDAVESPVEAAVDELAAAADSYADGDPAAAVDSIVDPEPPGEAVADAEPNVIPEPEPVAEPNPIAEPAPVAEPRPVAEPQPVNEPGSGPEGHVGPSLPPDTEPDSVDEPGVTGEPVGEPGPPGHAGGDLSGGAGPEGHVGQSWPSAVDAGQVGESSDPADDSADDPADDPDEDAGGEAVLVRDDLPDLSGDAELDAALETLLLVVDTPTTEEVLAETLDVPTQRVETALHRLADGYTEAGRGIDLRRAGEGWRFYTRDTYAPYVEKLLMDGQRAKLTRAALETLAVIAYRQPVTRSRVAAVRGVNVDGVIRTLLARGLVQETGTDADTGGTLYRTTELFLERLGLSSVDDLPPLAPLLPEVDSIDDV